MTPSYITGANGFIGTVLRDRLMGLDHLPIIWIPHTEIRNNGRRTGNLFFLSTYGNMAHHDDHQKMVSANVEDLIAITKSFTGWICYMSSSSVNIPVQTPYSRTKRAAEEILQSLPELDTCIVRPYSVFGKSEQPSHLIPTLMRSCFEGEKMNFAPDPVHDWIAVDDVVDALILFSEKQTAGIYELGTGWGRTNAQVLDTIERISGKRANIDMVTSLRSYDNTKWVCNDSNAQKLGWFPKRKFDETIEEVIEDYKQSPEKYANPKVPNL